ncbi:hypothetical protein WJX73_004946 [Symbiochloris irregularis]|uniref:Uncharacterized protein n=1 Tax=Symbiochloris irregularis TaxID=706552 RepID=A0AAW1Q2J8_9CHLO
MQAWAYVQLGELLHAELCCRSWARVLPQGSAVWGDLTVELGLLRPRIARGWTPASDSQLYLPTCRWLKAHASGIERLTLNATDLDNLESDDEDEEDEGTQARKRAQLLREGFAMVVASFSRLSVDLHVNFEDWFGLASGTRTVALIPRA